MDALKLLSTPHWQTRRRAIEALLAANDPSLPQELIALVREHHQDPNALNAALQLIARLPGVLPALRQLLQHPEADVRLYACNVLGLRADAPPAWLRPLLEDEDENVRFAAIEALGRLRDREAVPQLLAALQADSLQNAFAALQALRAIGDRQAAPQLIALLQNPLLAENAARILGEWQVAAAAPALLEALEANRLSLEAALEALARLPLSLPPELPALLGARQEAVLALCANPQTPAAVFSLLGRLIAQWPEDPLTAALFAQAARQLADHPSPPQPLLDMLAQGRPVHWPLLAPLLDSASTEARAAACQLAGRLGAQQAIPALREQLRTRREPEVLLAAIEALQTLQASAAWPELLALTANRRPRVRRAAVSALTALKTPEAEPAILGLLSHEDPAAREAGIQLLAARAAETDCSRYAAHVLALTSDPAPAVQKAALLALAPCSQDPQARAALESAASHPDARIRANAAEALGQADPDFALPRLHVLSQDEDLWVRLNAVRALGVHARETSLPWLEAASRDPLPPVRAAAAAALDAVGSPPALSLLETLSADPAPEVQAALQKLRRPGK